MKKILIQTVAAFIFCSSFSSAQSGIHEHDGFFLRMLYGFGDAQLTEKDVQGSDMKFSGFGQAIRFQIGGTVAENLILYGEFGGVMQFDPKLEWMGQSVTATDVTVSTFDFGGGITYYFMPSNIYFSISLLTSQATFEYQNIKGESQFGFGINGMIGKEWWVGEQWALGAALYGYYCTMKDEGTIDGVDYSSDINSYSIGVMFSATYN